MNIRWAIATVAALGLALLTLNAVPEWPFGPAEAAGSGPATSACPANAKPANLNFTLKDLNNKDVSLAALKGKVLLIDFWATWCGPCKIEIPWFIEFQQKYGKDGLQVLGVFVEDTLDKVKPYVVQMKMNYTILQGQDREDVQDAFGPMFGIPVTAVVSRDGKLCVKHTGLTGKDTFENEIKSLLDVPAAARTARDANP